MDAHADFDLVIGDGEGGLANLRHDAGRQRDAHGAGVIQRLLCGSRHAIQVAALVGSSAGDLECVDHAGNAAAAVGILLRRGGHVILDQHGLGDDVVLQLHGLAGHFKVHLVSAVVAVQAEHAVAAVAGADHVRHALCRRRGEHVADGAAVQQAAAHVAQEHRQMAAAARGDDADLALARRIGGEQHALVAVEQLDLVAVRRDDAVHRLVYEVLRLVDDLSHLGFLLSQYFISTRFRMRIRD